MLPCLLLVTFLTGCLCEREMSDIVICSGIAGSLDIGLSNWSFEFITITL